MRKVSVIIITRNRKEKLLQCINALSKNTVKNFEVIIIDQSDQPLNENSHKSLKKLPNLHLVPYKKKGKCNGLNYAIEISSSTLLAFTDDDCVPDINWIKNIVSCFNKNFEISGVFGIVNPFQPEKNKNSYCPCTFENINPDAHFISKPTNHWKNIGFGNNMAFRKKTFKEIGEFKTWLGPGSIGQGAEDADIALRALISKKILFYDPNIIVFHDKWLDENEKRKQDLTYLLGEIACYGHLSIQGHSFAKKVIKENLNSIMYLEPVAIIRSFFNLKPAYHLLFWWILRLATFIEGMFIAVFFSYKENSSQNM